MECGEYLLKKLPLGNRTIRILSSLNPKGRGTSDVLNLNLCIPQLLPQLITDERKNQFERQTRQFHADLSFPPYDSEVRVDVWWGCILKMPKYKLLAEAVLSLLTCFHGPSVEGSFSTLTQVVDPRRGRLTVESMDAWQTVKYTLRAAKESAPAYFHRENVQKTPVRRNLSVNMRSAKASYDKLRLKKAAEKEAKLAPIKAKKQWLKQGAAMSKKKHKEAAMNASKASREAHLVSMQKTQEG